MPAISPFFSSSRNNSQSSLRTSSLNTDTFAMDALEAKARIEYERERQKAHKGHDVRRKHSGLSIRSNHSATTAHKRSSAAALGQGNWRNSKITTDDMDDIDYAMDVDEDRFGNKENSRPSSRPVSVSLEDLAIRPGSVSSKKLRGSVSRTSLSSELHSRSSSSDSSSDSSILLSPMLPPSDYDSSTDDDLDDFDLQLDFPCFDEFSSPAVWTVAEAEDGAPQFRVNSQTSAPTSSSSSSRCTASAFASSSYW